MGIELMRRAVAADTADESVHVINGDVRGDERGVDWCGGFAAGAAYQRLALRSALVSCRDPKSGRATTRPLRS